MSGILVAIITVVGSGMISLLGAIVMGKLVPAGQVAAARAEADKWRLAYEEKTTAFDKLEAVVERQQIVTESVNLVLAALKQTAQTTLPPQPQVGGPV